MKSVSEVVYANADEARDIYDWVGDVCVALGAARSDLVPFEKYAAAAKGLVRPSSAAKAVFSGAPYIERVDRLVQLLARQKGMSHKLLDETVRLIDERLEANRKVAA